MNYFSHPGKGCNTENKMSVYNNILAPYNEGMSHIPSYWTVYLCYFNRNASQQHVLHLQFAIGWMTFPLVTCQNLLNLWVGRRIKHTSAQTLFGTLERATTLLNLLLPSVAFFRMFTFPCVSSCVKFILSFIQGLPQIVILYLFGIILQFCSLRGTAVDI